MTRRRLGGDAGGTVIEFALVAPILFMIMFALADLGLAELSDAAGANAAREGARVGVLHYDGAHTPGSPNNLAIVAAVNEKLARNVVGAPTVTVRCRTAAGALRPGSGSCSTVGTDVVDPGTDVIEVEVTWTRKSGLTGFLRNSTRTDRAVMRIVGTPPTGSAGPPPVCELSDVAATPATVVRAGATIPDVTFTATVNDPALCGSPSVDLTTLPQSGYSGLELMADPQSDGSYAFTMSGSLGTWTSGSKSVTITANGGATSATASFTVNDPVVCQITASGASPPSVTQTGGTLSSAVTFSVTVSSTAACGSPSLTFPANAGYSGAQPMTPTGAGSTTFTFVLPVGQGTWATQTHTVTASAAQGTTAAIPLTVSSAPTCTLTSLSVSPSSATVKKTGQQQIQTKVTIRVTRSSLTTCPTPTVRVTPGNSGSGANDLTTARTMRNVGTTTSCTNLTCEWVIAANTANWMPAPSTRTVTVASGSTTVTATLNLA